ncbi:MAG TPA: leucyl aminopeptidase, partial [Candidatus Corynebacterium gallistercoris]|nr:leucyl aminopeptidase [Candidatus Corynebacterium gallistercoris]
VGKGITFDTGGISLKPGANMDHMISDMGGSAAVVGATLAAARLELPVKVTATIPLAENMPSSSATRPGDILRHYNGLTTEVLNTDAEGRLILADAISRACEDEPDYLIETATLTGAQLVALGERTPGIMGSIAFRDRVSQLSQDVGENGWPMPLPAELGEALKSDVADLKNISSSRWGGMSVAGHYLSNFVTEGVEWVHIDVAGPAFNTGSAHGYTPKRGTGVPVRTIIAALEDIAQG